MRLDDERKEILQWALNIKLDDKRKEILKWALDMAYTEAHALDGRGDLCKECLNKFEDWDQVLKVICSLEQEVMSSLEEKINNG